MSERTIRKVKYGNSERLSFAQVQEVIEMPQQKPDLMCRSYCERFRQKNSTSHWDKSAHSEIRDFYAHMALTRERHFARCFCRYSGNIAQRYFRHNKKEEAVAFTIFFRKGDSLLHKV